MTPEEEKALRLLAEAWNVFVTLPEMHHMDRHEFAHAIHAAQNIILSRVGLRAQNLPPRLEPDRRVNLEPPTPPDDPPGYTTVTSI